MEVSFFRYLSVACVYFAPALQPIGVFGFVSVNRAYADYAALRASPLVRAQAEKALPLSDRASRT